MTFPMYVDIAFILIRFAVFVVN